MVRSACVRTHVAMTLPRCVHLLLAMSDIADKLLSR